MYNRYIPGANGAYERLTVQEPATVSERPEPTQSSLPQKTETAQQQRSAEQSRSSGPDLGDLLLLCIIVLLLIDADENDLLPAVTLAAALFLQP